jgi:hypothetical protein
MFAVFIFFAEDKRGLGGFRTMLNVVCKEKRREVEAIIQTKKVYPQSQALQKNNDKLFSYKTYI